MERECGKGGEIKGMIIQSWICWCTRLTFLQPIAEELGATQSQLALAWCLKNENVSSVITGASRPEQIVENVKSLQFLDKLTPEVMQRIDELVGSKPALDPARQD
jgi:aryl-alcohol dehydrogenase-like predicted oxidoreductase